MTRALVTGAGGGLGAALATALVQHGVDVILVDRNPDVRTLADELQCEAIVCDLSDANALYALLDRIDGSIQILINNAGAAAKGPLAHQAADSIEQLIRLNVTAPTLLAQRFIASNPAAPACLVFISSSMAIAPTPFLGTYGASKAFQTSLAEALDVEALLGAAGHVRIVCAEPSGMATGFQAAAGVGHADSKLLLDPQEVADRIVRSVLVDTRQPPFLRIGATGKALAFGRRVLPRRIFTRLSGRLLARFR